MRSLFYLFYWEKTSFINDTNFRENLVPAISGALVEVRFEVITIIINHKLENHLRMELSSNHPKVELSDIEN